MRIALDTNVLAYLANVARVPADVEKVAIAQSLVGGLKRKATLVIPAQALGELFNVIRKTCGNPRLARDVVTRYAQDYLVVESPMAAFLAALDLAVDHQLQIWDSLILTAAADATCSMFLSEDMHDGFVVRGMTIINPFAVTLHPRLQALMTS